MPTQKLLFGIINPMREDGDGESAISVQNILANINAGEVLAVTVDGNGNPVLAGSILPIMEDFYLAGTCQNDGDDYVESTTPATGSGYDAYGPGVWDSRTNTVNVTDWSDSLPIVIGDTVTKTILELRGRIRIDSNYNEHQWYCNVTIDWRTRIATGIYHRIAADLAEGDPCGRLYGAIDDWVDGVAEFTKHYGGAIARPSIKIIGRTIYGLPKCPDNTADDLQCHVKNYSVLTSQ